MKATSVRTGQKIMIDGFRIKVDYLYSHKGTVALGGKRLDNEEPYAATVVAEKEVVLLDWRGEIPAPPEDDQPTINVSLQRQRIITDVTMNPRFVGDQEQIKRALYDSADEDNSHAWGESWTIDIVEILHVHTTEDGQLRPVGRVTESMTAKVEPPKVKVGS